MGRPKYFSKMELKTGLLWNWCAAWLFHFSAVLSPVYFSLFLSTIHSATPLIPGCELALSKTAWMPMLYFIEPCGFTLWACFKAGISGQDGIILDKCPTLLYIFRLISLPPFSPSFLVITFLKGLASSSGWMGKFWNLNNG